MPEHEPWPDNAAGPFCVDSECIDCDACRGLAPRVFGRNERRGFSFVARQPQDEEEREACREAAQRCPVRAIHENAQRDTPERGPCASSPEPALLHVGHA
jgi:ferredoxin